MNLYRLMLYIIFAFAVLAALLVLTGTLQASAPLVDITYR